MNNRFNRLTQFHSRGVHLNTEGSCVTPYSETKTTPSKPPQSYHFFIETKLPTLPCHHRCLLSSRNILHAQDRCLVPKTPTGLWMGQDYWTILVWGEEFNTGRYDTDHLFWDFPRNKWGSRFYSCNEEVSSYGLYIYQPRERGENSWTGVF